MSAVAFQDIEATLEAKLVAVGYWRELHEYNGAFGSHYSDFVLESEAVRLIADAREFAVFLDYSRNYFLHILHQDWNTLAHIPYPPNFDEANLASLQEKVLSVLDAHLASNAA